jgi:hypothetical protein
MSARGYTYRDAGLHSAPLRLLNRVTAPLGWLGVRWPSLAPDDLLAAARKQTGLEDFGADTIREPLEVFQQSLEEEANLSSFGRMVLRQLIVSSLSERLRVLDWAANHPEVREEKIERPWIILGLPRTGTTLLSLLLGLDPVARPLLQWEASHPIPPPDLATHAEDPRIAEVAKQFTQLQELNPPLRAMHPFGATLATECVTLFAFDLRALSFETQALIPSYGRWLEKTDMRSAYEMHKLSLQILQSRLPTESWSLKTPNHLWCLDLVQEFYPDARLIWTHRDPAKVVTSVASLNASLHKVNCTRVDPVAVGCEWDNKLHAGITRGMEFDDRQSGAGWCSHLLYRELMADPIAAVRRLYAEFDTDLHPLHVRRMENWMRNRGQDAFGRHVYDPADFGLAEDEIRDRYRGYTTRYEIPSE